MKKIVLLAITLLGGVLSAGAWSRNVDKGVLLFAAKQFTPATQQVVASYAGKDFARVEGAMARQRKAGTLPQSEGWHTLHLDRNLQPSAKDDNDAYIQIKKAAEVLRNHKQHERDEVKLAFCVVTNLMLDMHNIANVALEEYPLSGTNFEFTMTKGTARGRKAKVIPFTWKELWDVRYTSFHSGYSPEMWAEELEVMYGDKKAELSAGSLRDWAVDMGNFSRPIYERLKQENNHCPHATICSYDIPRVECFAKAAYRLAALLNETLK